MLRLLLGRLLLVVPLLLAVSFLVFSLVALIPGDPAVALAGNDPTPERIATIRTQLGLDQPYVIRYWWWLKAALHGDFGASLFSDYSVSGEIAARLPTTLSLGFVATSIAILIGVPLGALAGLGAGTWIDKIATVLASLGVAVPYFWVGMMLIATFALDYRLFPAVGYVPFEEDPGKWLWHLTLPGLALSTTPMAIIARQTRASMVQVMAEDYIRTAKAKGLSRAQVISKHALKNAALPVVTVIGIEVSRLLGGAVVIEQLFSLPGIGKLAFDAVFDRDFPIVQGVVLIAASMVILSNLIVDVSYGLFNPKLRS